MKKILIVDDDATIREVLKTLLAGTYNIREAESRAEGLKLAKSYKPDLILLDAMMEYSSAGFDMAREIKGSKSLNHIKIIMLTNIDRDTKLNFKASAKDPDWLPVDDFIDKPADPKKLLEKIKKLI